MYHRSFTPRKKMLRLFRVASVSFVASGLLDPPLIKLDGDHMMYCVESNVIVLAGLPSAIAIGMVLCFFVEATVLI